jgi:hypothetical protein
MTGGNEGARSAPDAWGAFSFGVICGSFSKNKNFRPVTTFSLVRASATSERKGDLAGFSANDFQRFRFSVQTPKRARKFSCRDYRFAAKPHRISPFV